MGDDDPVFQKLPDDELRKVAKELSADTLSAISTLFPVATSIQQWLKTCLEVIFHSSVSGNTAGGTSNTMTWNSPLGFPITQGYREQITETVCPCDIALLKKERPIDHALLLQCSSRFERSAKRSRSTGRTLSSGST